MEARGMTRRLGGRSENDEATPGRGFSFLEERNSGRIVRSPIRQLDALFYFSSFVAVFLGFLLSVDDLAEGVFGANDIGNNIQ
jgi:hypothetical protein